MLEIDPKITYNITNKKTRKFFVIRYFFGKTKTPYEINAPEFHYKDGSQLETKHFIEQNALIYINKDMDNRNLATSNGITLKKLVDLYLDDKESCIGVRASTTESNRAILNKYLIATYKKLRLDKIEFSKTISMETTLSIKQAINHGSYLTKDGSKQEITQTRKQRIYNELKAFYQYCRESKFITSDQANEVIDAFPNKMIVRDIKEVGNNYLTIEEMQIFLDTFNEEDEIWRMFFYIMFKLGLRVGENMALKFTDIDEPHNVINIHDQIDKHGKQLDHTKTNTSTAPVHIDNSDILKLKEYQKEYIEGPNDFIFFVTTHTSYTTAKRILIKHLKMATLKTITLHGFRHSICVFLCNQGIMTIEEISKFMRHSSIQITLKYYAKWLRIDENIKTNYDKSFDQIKIN